MNKDTLRAILHNPILAAISVAVAIMFVDVVQSPQHTMPEIMSAIAFYLSVIYFSTYMSFDSVFTTNDDETGERKPRKVSSRPHR